ncbi:hypothetical protein BCR39DRAFT_598483 [Naematelia encephala]|uniref:Uncharacterized protein n=1 Tax=Naematelia encephala TaxID=71784 RepID=A0A1Y2B7Z7_9TREE|nr:hypothetical protein BCR39DRAFT_598483 [Naematelia encephala]
MTSSSEPPIVRRSASAQPVSSFGGSGRAPSDSRGGSIRRFFHRLVSKVRGASSIGTGTGTSEASASLLGNSGTGTRDDVQTLDALHSKIFSLLETSPNRPDAWKEAGKVVQEKSVSEYVREIQRTSISEGQQSHLRAIQTYMTSLPETHSKTARKALKSSATEAVLFLAAGDDEARKATATRYTKFMEVHNKHKSAFDTL